MIANALTDTHLHLTHERFADDLESVLLRAALAGVATLVTIGTTPADGRAGLEIAERYAGRPDMPRIFSAIGFHPHDAAHFTDKGEAELRELLRHPRVVGVGEVGLDYHYDFAPRDVQRRVFERQIALACEADLPIVIHCREAFDDVAAVLRAAAHPRLRGVFHCFSEGPAEAEAVLALGFMLGLGGVATFPKSDAVREAARLAGLDRFVLETDAPYLAPIPLRGKRNEPAYVAHTAACLGAFLGAPASEIATRTSANAARLFALQAAEVALAVGAPVRAQKAASEDV